MDMSFSTLLFIMVGSLVNPLLEFDFKADGNAAREPARPVGAHLAAVRRRRCGGGQQPRVAPEGSQNCNNLVVFVCL